MPRTLSPTLKSHLAGDLLTVATIVKITRTDGLTLGFTSHSEDLVLGGLTYAASDGLTASALQQSGAASPTTMDVVGILSDSRITDADLLARKWDFADVLVSLVNWADLSMGTMILSRFKIGGITYTDGQFKAELQGISDPLKQTVSAVTSKTCRCRRLGDLQCKVSLAGFQFGRTVTAINNTAPATGATTLYQIDCGSDRLPGAAITPYLTDRNYSGGGIESTADDAGGAAIDMTAVAGNNPAPEKVYETWRSAKDGASPFTYTFTGLTAGASYRVRLHFQEPFYNASAQRMFNVLVNGSVALYNYDIWRSAGRKLAAVIEEFDCIADASGHIALTCQGRAICSGIELQTPAVGALVGGIQFGTDSAPTGYYNFGIVYWLTGLNAGTTSDVKIHVNASGVAVISLRLPPPFPVSVGDTVTLEAGCPRSFGVCTAKFANGPNFHGEDLLPGNDLIMQTGRG